MSIFRVHVVARAEAYGASFYSELENLFNRVCQNPASGFKEASVYWWTDRPVHNLVHEPIVWLVENKDASMIKQAYKNVQIPSHVAGMTFWRDKGMVSEVYLNHPALEGSMRQAKMAFHELMHNKLQVGNELHGSDFGFGLNRELLDMATIFSATLDPENIQKLAPALSKPVTQWTPAFG